MKRILVVGTGPSGFAVLNSLDNSQDVWVMDGQTNFDDSTISTRSHLALKMKFGSMHTYVDSKSLGLIDDSSYKLPISYSRGGFGEIWGNGFTPYHCSEIFPNASPEFQDRLTDAMGELLRIIPFSHSPSELDLRFGNIDSWSSSKSYGKLTWHSGFERFLRTRKKKGGSNLDGLLFGPPSFLLDSNRCTNCGLCLSGCPYGALFDPGEHINRMFASNELDINKLMKGIVKRLDPTSLGVGVYFETDGIEKSELFDEVILSTGPLSTALILMNSGLIPDEFEIPDSQVFYGAFVSRKRFRPSAAKKEVGQFVCYPQESLSEDFQISFYSPSELSRKRISQTIFPTLLSRLKIPKFVSERIIPAIGFLPQDLSGKIVIKRVVEGFSISRDRNPSSVNSSRKALRRVSRTMRHFGFVNVSIATQIPAPGSGFHIGASLPLGGIYVDDMGYLNNAPNIRVLDASILPKIPAGAHTFFSMALIKALMEKSS
jgi:ferredoxin